MIDNKNKKNLCESCEYVHYLTKIDSDGTEICCYDCPFSEKHSFPICECSNYSRPNAFTKLFRNKFLVFCISFVLVAFLAVLAITLLS